MSCGACAVASTLYLLRHAASNESTNTKKRLKNERNKEREQNLNKVSLQLFEEKPIKFFIYLYIECKF